MVRFIKSLLSAGMLVGLGLAVGCSGSDTGTSSQTKKDASGGMNMMKQKQEEMSKKHGQPGGAAADDADKDKADDKKDDKKADDKPKADKKDK
jgi:hypothetical protein